MLADNTAGGKIGHVSILRLSEGTCLVFFSVFTPAHIIVLNIFVFFVPLQLSSQQKKSKIGKVFGGDTFPPPQGMPERVTVCLTATGDAPTQQVRT